MKFRSLAELRGELIKSPELKAEFSRDPMSFLERVEPIKNKSVFLYVVSIVGVVLIGSIILSAIIIFKSENPSAARVPEFLVTIGSAALGAMVGLLTPSPDRE